MTEEHKEFKPIPLDKLIDSLYFKLEVEAHAGIHAQSYMETLLSIIYYLEDYKKVKK